jgi:hypothetical protein
MPWQTEAGMRENNKEEEAADCMRRNGKLERRGGEGRKCQCQRRRRRD